MKAKECRWRLSTIRQSYDGHMQKMLDELDELERLARIGKAFELAKEKEFEMFRYAEYSGGRTKKFPISEEEYESVLSWYESEEIDDDV